MPGQPNRDYRDRCASVLSCHRLYCGALVAVLPADSIGLHRVGVYLRLVDKAAFDASQCPVLEAGTCCGNALDLHARLAFGTTRPRRRARRWGGCLWIGKQILPLNLAGSVTELSVTENCQGRSVMIQLAPFAVRDAGQYCSFPEN
jgi:hypothetical protein